ncbi:hypothetical protein QEN48_05705 [Methanonatronarchaeum sp. AMET-Sl]|nr:hypothetical protein [Methanonatronarchaeum sp. AMET-Sl]WGI16995.1 hypothetical protein QEN48_05705 [Methanonatronarchaeum sp. AMET-Sl]
MSNKKEPVFCEKYCPVCRPARAGYSFFEWIQGIELRITGDEGCPFGQARYDYYGVKPDEPIPKDEKT